MDDEYRQMVADLIGEIEVERRQKREGGPVAGVEAILSHAPTSEAVGAADVPFPVEGSEKELVG
ncbi:MAG TPA: hypothetical protein VGG06_34525 [Thermoanaerobaculia bacterium]|jgi:molybdopterin-guanine dinucleotide biosynthesis protein A